MNHLMKKFLFGFCIPSFAFAMFSVSAVASSVSSTVSIHAVPAPRGANDISSSDFLASRTPDMPSELTAMFGHRSGGNLPGRPAPKFIPEPSGANNPGHGDGATPEPSTLLLLGTGLLGIGAWVRRSTLS